jgi:hypothetical protein
LLTSNPRKGLQMKNKKLAATLALPVSALLIILGTQSGVGAFATGIDGVAETPITTSASADTILQCGWRISGVESTISLANAVPTLEYVGTEYALAGSDTGILIHLSGDATEGTRCSFYNEYKGAQVKVSWDGVAFTGSPDNSLGWSVEDSALGITYTDTDCVAAWVTEPSLTISAAMVPAGEVVPAAILATSVDTSIEYSPDAVTGATFPSCGFSASYSTAIPLGKTPGSPGTTYSFTGPTLTSTLVLEP